MYYRKDTNNSDCGIQKPEIDSSTKDQIPEMESIIKEWQTNEAANKW